jgi:hypothetical protein
MSNSSITLHEIIDYFKGTAPQSLINQIESQRITDIHFDEEMIDWEGFVSTQSSRTEAIEKIRAFHHQWHQPIEIKGAIEKEVTHSSLRSYRLPLFYWLFMVILGLFVFSLFYMYSLGI